MQTADYQQQSRKIIFEFRTQNIQSAVNFEVYARRQNAEFFGNIVITHAAEAAFQENRPGLFRHFVQRTLQDAENLLLEQPVGIARRQRRDIGLDQPALGTMDSMRRLEVHGLIAQIIQGIGFRTIVKIYAGTFTSSGSMPLPSQKVMKLSETMSSAISLSRT